MIILATPSPRQESRSLERCPGEIEQWERDGHGHRSERITVEHALADHERWKQLTRSTHRRDRLPDTYRAIAGRTTI